MSVSAARAVLRHWRGHLLTISAIAGLVSARSAILASFGVGLGFAIHTVWTIASVADKTGDNALVGLPMCVLAAAIFVLALYLARRAEPVPVRWFVPIALLAAIAIRLLYFFFVDPAWVSDFGRYWKVAVEMANADHYQVTNVYHQRALPYLVPIAEFFGQSRDSVKLANIVTLSLIQLMGYDVLRRSHGHQAAQCFTILWIGAPEPLYSMLIPSHDLVAMGQLAVVVWLTVLAVSSGKGGKRKFRFLAYAIPISITLVALELQRGIGLILLAVLLAVGIAGVLVSRRFPSAIRDGKEQTLRLLWLALLSLPLYLGSMSCAERLGLEMPQKAAYVGMLRYTTAHATSLSDGSYAWMIPFHDTFTTQYGHDTERTSGFRESLVLSDFIEDPAARVGNAAGRLANLYFLGGSNYFYTAGFADDSPKTTLAMVAYNNAFAGLFAVFALLALVGLLIRPMIPLIAAVLLVLIAAITLSLALVAENQPRYLYVVWFVGATTIAFGFAREALAHGALEHGSRSKLVRSIAWLVVQAAVCATLVVAATWILASSTYGPASGRILSHWSLSVYQPAAPAVGPEWAREFESPESGVLRDADPKNRLAPKRFGPLALTLQLPHAPTKDDHVDARRQICMTGGAHDNLTFFVYTPYKKMKRRGAFALEVLVDGHPRWSLPLPHAKTARLIEIPNLIPPDGCSELTFSLRSNVTIPSDSWRRASRVEIYFPRLTDHVR